jgi:hypothetical protein
VVLAQKIQNIIMFPGVCEYTKLANSKLIANCLVGHVDIMAAERIFGTNVGALKGDSGLAPQCLDELKASLPASLNATRKQFY